MPSPSTLEGSVPAYSFLCFCISGERHRKRIILVAYGKGNWVTRGRRGIFFSLFALLNLLNFWNIRIDYLVKHKHLNEKIKDLFPTLSINEDFIVPAFLESCTGADINGGTLAVVLRSHLWNVHNGTHSGTWSICSGKSWSDPPFHLILPVSPSIFQKALWNWNAF